MRGASPRASAEDHSDRSVPGTVSAGEPQYPIHSAMVSAMKSRLDDYMGSTRAAFASACSFTPSAA